MLTLICLGTHMLLNFLAVGLKRVGGIMPVASSCSLAIAAACHPPADDDSAALSLVRWGEVPDKDVAQEGL